MVGCRRNSTIFFVSASLESTSNENIVAEIAASNKSCVYCGRAVAGSNAHFCPACDRIQPLARDADYFSFFGVPRRLVIDESALEREFYALSRRLHPDYFTTASPAEQQASIDRSSTLNDAYRALRDPVARAKYLLTLEGYREAEKKAPPELLEEVFELNMQFEELKAAKKSGDEDDVAEARASLEQALAGLKDKLDDLDQRMFALFRDWDVSMDDGAVQQSKLLSHRAYIANLVRDIGEEI